MKFIFCGENVLCKHTSKNFFWSREPPKGCSQLYSKSNIWHKVLCFNHAITHLLYCLYFSWIVEIVSLGVTDFYMQVLGFISRGNKLEHILYTKRQRAYWYTYRVQSQREFILILPSCLHIPAFAGCVLFLGKQKYD